MQRNMCIFVGFYRNGSLSNAELIECRIKNYEFRIQNYIIKTSFLSPQVYFIKKNEKAEKRNIRSTIA